MLAIIIIKNNPETPEDSLIVHAEHISRMTLEQVRGFAFGTYR